MASAIAMALLGFAPAVSSDPVEELGDPIANALCSEHDENSEPVIDAFHTQPAPTLEFPDLTLTTHVMCLQLGLNAPDTDCTSTAFTLTGWKWNAAYNGKVDTTNPFGFSSATVVNFFNSGSNTWDNTVAADIFGSITAGGSAGAIRQFDGVNQHGFKKGGNYVAVTYTWSSGGNAVESDAAYNTMYPFGVNGEANKIDLGHVQTHEIGHTFGLGHPPTNAANACLTMYAYVDYGITYGRTLGDGDILGIDNIY